MNTPLSSARSVCVILPTYNRAALLAEALDSLLKQTRRPDRILVVDDGSTDHTPELLGEYQASIDVVRTLNRGKPAAVNTALKTVRSDFIWVFDDDDVALPETLALHIAYLEAHPDIDFTYSDKYIFEGSGDIWQKNRWRISPLPDIAPEDFLFRTMLSMNTLMQGMLIPRQCLIDINLFDESLDRCEDHDMIMRLAARYRGANLGSPTFVYREHSGARGAGLKSHAAEQRSRVLADYRRQVFRKLRSQLPLDRYLMHRQASPVWEDADGLEAAALVQRACVMLRHGLIVEGAADLEAGLSNPAILKVDTNWLDDVFAQSLDVEPWILGSRRLLARDIMSVLDRNQRLAHGSAFIRGIYWHMRHALDKRQARQVLASGALLSIFGATWMSRRLRERAKMTDP